MSDSQHLISATRSWVDQVVIRHNFCPFAGYVRDHDQIRYTVSLCAKRNLVLETLMAECRYLDGNADTATTLLILGKGFESFDRYLSLLELAETLLEEQGYEGVYQLASFHPHYLFEGESADSPSHCTNRSPYPILHLLREADISKALDNYPHPERIFENNIRTTDTLGQAYFDAALKKCRQHR